eukprot:5646816-Karenia_brevis.AAC.1
MMLFKSDAPALQFVKACCEKQQSLGSAVVFTTRATVTDSDGAGPQTLKHDIYIVSSHWKLSRAGALSRITPAT